MSEPISEDTITSGLQGDREAISQMALRARLSEEVVTAALSGDRECIRLLTAALNGELTPEQQAYRSGYTAGQERADFLHAADKFKEKYADLYADGLEKAVNEIDKTLAEKAPNVPYTVRLDEVGRLSYKAFGTPEERAIRQMKLQRQPWLKEQDLMPDVSEHKPDEFEVEHQGGKDEGIEQLRQGRAGRVLSPEQRQRALEWDEILKRRRQAGG
jgi:hypothetical protein